MESLRRPYGSLSFSSDKAARSNEKASRDRRANLLVAVFALLVPWLVFTANFALLSFTEHFRHPQMCRWVVELTAALVIVSAILAFVAVRNKKLGLSKRDPTWSILVATSLGVAWCLGVGLGATNYVFVMRPVYERTSLEMYPDVDPGKANGAQLLDAGRIVFTRTSRVDVAQSFGFKSDRTYCVAPIVPGPAPDGSAQRLASYDFWAVGTGCCTEGGADFHCGSTRSPAAHAAARWLSEAEVPSFRHAVAQAEQRYGIRAGHPLFFSWTEDPISEVENRTDAGLKNFLLGTLSFFAFQLFGVVLVAVRMGVAKGP